MIARIWRGWITPYEAAYVPPRARAVLPRFDERSAHYETLLRPPSP
jgi:hypothetical protein